MFGWSDRYLSCAGQATVRPGGTVGTAVVGVATHINE